MKKNFSFSIFKFRFIRGFTLIELLIVIVIITILGGISLFALQGTRSSARDAKRKADLEHIASGLELFKADCTYYPYSFPSPGNPLTGSECTPPNNNIYIQAIPDDPDSSRDYRYAALGCVANPSPPPDFFCPRFRVWAALESQPTPTLPPGCPAPIPSCGSGYTCNYCVHNP